MLDRYGLLPKQIATPSVPSILSYVLDDEGQPMELKRVTWCPLLFAVLALCPAGCSDVILSGDIKSCTPVSSGVSGCRGIVPSGVAYALPKGQVQLTWTRSKTAPSDLQKAQSALASAQQTLAKDQSTLATTQAKNASDPTIPGLQTQIQADQTAVGAATTGLTAANAAQTTFTETVTLTVLPVVPDPDPKAHFITNLAHTALRNDSLNVGVSNGLLNSAAATSADQTPSIITTLANTAITFAAIAGTGGTAGPVAPPAAPGAPGAPPPPPPPPCPQDSWSVIFDPVNSAEAAAAKAALAAHTQNIVLRADGAAPPAISIAPPTGPQVSGLVYRAMTATTLTVGPNTVQTPPCPLLNPPAAQSIVAVVLDSNTAYLVPAHAGAFTTSTFNFGFTNGTLTAYSNQQPSEIAAVAGIPLNIAQSVMSIPTQILQLRVNYDTAATALVNAKSQLSVAQTSALTAAANAQTQLVQAESALTQAQASAAAAGPAGQASVIAAQTNVINAQAAAIQAQQALQALQATAPAPATTK
jgi:hypothetical protein